ncbi:conjugal transfer protein TraN [Photobacterium leiognathi]|uniref:conjugal transfer protein TraN n=1 Tax=Photobacterium leiognathi TaxID=553611 RepID=UPI003AF38D8B
MDKVSGKLGKYICYLLIFTTQWMALNIAYAQDRFNEAVSNANNFSRQMLDSRALPSFNANGDVMKDGKVLISKEHLTGSENESFPAETDSYGNDSGTIIQGESAIAKYNQTTLDSARNNSEKAYHMVKNSFDRQKPDLTNDPMWGQTDKTLSNLADIAAGFSSCKLDKQLVSTGKDYHVPKIETCTKLPAQEGTFSIGHDYDVGIIKHESGPVNILSCGEGCIRVRIGTVGNDYWSGWCTLYEEQMALRVIQPQAITYVELEKSVYDDYHQVWLNDDKVYNGPNANFPPETAGECELSTSWVVEPKINLTPYFTDLKPDSVLQFKTRTSVAGNGEGYSSMVIHYDPNKLIHNDVWVDDERVAKAKEMKKQADDGFCKFNISCKQQPVLDENKCTQINGFNVCESAFGHNPLAEFGISPFCKRAEISSTCEFNQAELCYENIQGEIKCFDNKTVNKNTCKEYEENPQCSYKKTECVEGALGASGKCYVQEETFDCGFTASTGTEVEEEVLICDGKLQCVGEACYSPARDQPNGDFGEVNAYLEMLKYARADMNCKNVPERPYDADNPPDRYSPVTGCPAGYYYEKNSDLCLKEIGCTYSENDYYAASLRDGIEIVANNTVVVADTSKTQCLPVNKNGMIFTCGAAVKKLATDTFYEVCTNHKATSTPNSCPSDSHILNSKTDYCEVPPTVTCPADYELVKGDDDFSELDDVCQSKTFAVNKSCPAGYTMQGDQCKKEVTQPIQRYCPSGYWDNGSNCKKTTDTNLSYSCPAGYEKSGDRCRKHDKINYTYYCPSGSVVSGNKCKYTNTIPKEYGCSSGKLEDGKCVNFNSTCTYIAGNTQASYMESTNATAVVWGGSLVVNFTSNDLSGWFKGTDGALYKKILPIRNKYSDSWSGNIYYYGVCRNFETGSSPQLGCPPTFYASGSVCKKDTYTDKSKSCPAGYYDSAGVCNKISWADKVAYCPSGYYKSSGKCKKDEYANKLEKCNSGYSIQNGLCRKIISNEVVRTCPTGFELTPDRENCVKNPFHVAAEKSCPSLYPIWDEADQRCVSEPISATTVKSASLSDVLDDVLTPFESLIDGIVPKAYASDEVLLEPIQERMNGYIGDKFKEIEHDIKYKHDMMKGAQRQLASYAAVPLRSMAAPTAFQNNTQDEVGDTSNGVTDKNVTCTLFDGKAAECKIAVGGMQDCCKAPVPVSLGDYIALTEKMLTMDGLTAELGLIDGYSGVWQPVKDLASEAADAAYNAIQSTFSSAADVAAGAAEDAVTQGIFSEVKQQIMSYAYDFMIEQFGEEVAKMFFQETGKQLASGAAELALSPQMQAAGQALMYVYYVYLAYVVFTLLVNIVYACTEEEMDLATKRDLLSTHYLGSYCKTKVLGACIEKRQAYCQFDSPLSRIVMEQVYMQPHMGLSWGTAKNPNCQGLAIDQIAKVNWDAVNFDEWIGILVKTGNYHDNQDFNIDALTGSGSMLNRSSETPRKNVLETNMTRFEDIDADEVRRAAYEDAHNKLQPE